MQRPTHNATTRRQHNKQEEGTTTMARVGIASGSDDYSRGSSSSGQNKVSIDFESIRLHVSSWVARVQSRISLDTLRPLPVFLGINPTNSCFSAEAFTPPVKKIDKSSFEKIKSRMKLNFAFFVSNYALVASMVALVVAMLHPGMLLAVGLIWGLWTFHHFLIRHEFIVFGFPVHSLLTIQQRFYTLFVLTTFVVVWKCLKPTILFLFVSGMIIVTHSFLRDPKHIESSNADWLEGGGGTHDSDEEGGSGGEASTESEVLVERPKGGVQRRGDTL